MNQSIQVQIVPDALKEPITHQKNKTVSEQMFGSCTNQNYDLNKQELIEYWSLRKEMNELYDSADPNCVKRIKGLWYILTDTDLEEADLKNQGWTKFGFQQANPTTDFRGGGIQSLDDIINFATDNRQFVLEKMCDPQNDFFFAASSINVTFFMKKWFHLLDHLHPDKDKKELCSRKALKMFCHFLVKEDNLWKQLHQLFFHDLFQNCWLGLRKKRPNVTILDYGEAFEEMKRKINSQTLTHQCITTKIQTEQQHLIPHLLSNINNIFQLSQNLLALIDMMSKLPPMPLFVQEQISKGSFFECKHCHDGSCEDVLLERYSIFYELQNQSFECNEIFFKILSTYPFDTITFIQKKSIKIKILIRPIQTLAKALFHYFKSLCFISLFVASIRYLLCKLKNWRRVSDGWNPTIAAIVGANFVCLESEGRRWEIALFILPRFLETIAYFLRKRRLVPNIPNGEALMFAFTIGMLHYYCQHDERAVKETFRKVFQSFWGKN